MIASALKCALSSGVLWYVRTVKKLAGPVAYSIVILLFALALPFCHSTRNWNKRLEALTLKSLSSLHDAPEVAGIRFLTITLGSDDPVVLSQSRDALRKDGVPGRIIGLAPQVIAQGSDASSSVLTLFLVFDAMGIRLVGEIPGELERENLLEIVRERYSENKVDDRLELKPGVQSLEKMSLWSEFLPDLLSSCSSGKLRYENGSLVLSGTCKTAGGHERLLKLAEELSNNVVADDFQLEPVPVPATMTVEHDGSTVTLSGTVPDTEVLEAMDAVARQAVDVDDVVSEVQMPPNVMPPEWFGFAVSCLGDIMKELSHKGKVSFSGNKLVVEGVTDTLGQRYRLNRYLESIDPDQWEIQSLIDVRPPDTFSYSVSTDQGKRFVFGAVHKESTRSRLKKAVVSASKDLHHEVQVAKGLRAPSWIADLPEFVADILKSAPDANLRFGSDKVILANVSAKETGALLGRTLKTMPGANVVLTTGKLDNGSGVSVRKLNAELAKHPIGFSGGFGKFTAPSQSTEIEEVVRILALHGFPVVRLSANLNPDRGATVKIVVVRLTTVREALVANRYPEDRIQVFVRRSKDPLERYNSVTFLAVP